MTDDFEDQQTYHEFRCESMSPHRKPGMKAFRQFRPCCITKFRDGYTLGKNASRKQSKKARRSKPKSKDHR